MAAARISLVRQLFLLWRRGRLHSREATSQAAMPAWIFDLLMKKCVEWAKKINNNVMNDNKN